MRFPSIPVVRREQAQEWFWRLVFVGVVCDFLYLGWLAVRSLQR